MGVLPRPIFMHLFKCSLIFIGSFLLSPSLLIAESDSTDSVRNGLIEKAQATIQELRDGPYHSELLVSTQLLVEELQANDLHHLSASLGKLAWEKYSFDRTSLAYLNLSLELAEHYLFMEQIDSVVPYLDVIEECATTSGTWSCKGSYFEIKGLVADANGNLIEASRYYTKAQLIYRDADQPFKLNEINIRLGATLTNLHEYQEAVKILNPSLKFLQHGYPDNSNINTVSTNLGICFKELEMSDSAMYYYKIARQFIHRTNNTSTLAVLYSNMGNLYLSLKEYDGALAYIDSSLALCVSSNIEVGILINQLNLAQVFMEQGNFTESLDRLNSVKSLLNIYRIPDLNQAFLQNYSETLYGLGRYNEAYDYLKKHSELKDSLESASTKHTVEIWKSEYEKQVTEIENIELQNTLAEKEHEHQIFWLIVIGVMFLLLTILTIQHFRIRLSKAIQSRKDDAKKNAEELLELKTKEALSQSLQLANFIEYSKAWEDQLKELKETSTNSTLKTKISAIIRDMHRKLTNKHWDEFESHLAQLNYEFYHKLLGINDDLTPTELKVAAMLKMNLSSKEIASLTGRSSRTIDNLRSLIRKKLSKEVEIQDLQAFLIAL